MFISHRFGIAYQPIPKNACTSIKHALYELETGRPYALTPESSGRLSIHDAIRTVRMRDWLPVLDEYLTFAVVRDPVDRLISVYKNRVLHYKILAQSERQLSLFRVPVEPTLHQFIRYLPIYRRVSKDIRHHSTEQAYFLGSFSQRFRHMLPFEKLSDLHSILEEHTGEEIILTKRQDGGPRISRDEIDSRHLQILAGTYRNDYALLSNYYAPPTPLYGWIRRYLTPRPFGAARGTR